MRAINLSISNATHSRYRSRLPHYKYSHQEGFPIRSGAVESAVKQIGRRIKLSGAQWAVVPISMAISAGQLNYRRYLSIITHRKGEMLPIDFD